MDNQPEKENNDQLKSALNWLKAFLFEEIPPQTRFHMVLYLFQTMFIVAMAYVLFLSPELSPIYAHNIECDQFKPTIDGLKNHTLICIKTSEYYGLTNGLGNYGNLTISAVPYSTPEIR